MPQVTGVVEARNERAVMVAGEWYGSFKGKGLEAVKKGDMVDISWEPDKTGRYKNVKGVAVLSTGIHGGSSTAASPSYTPRSNVGVELGHAANLSKDLVIEMLKTSARAEELGSNEFYKMFVEHTGKFFKIMKRLRAAAEAGKDIESLVASKEGAATAPAPEPVVVDEEDMKSIF